MRRQNNELKNYLYLKAFERILREYTEKPDITNRIMYIQRLVYYGVKTVVTNPVREYTTRDQGEFDFQFISIIKSLVGLLTPGQFMEVFPISKDFKGHKYEMKDYFYTRDHINTLDPSKSIGEDSLMFLWEYTNKDIEIFNINSMLALSKLRQLEGYPSLSREWADENGIKTHTLHTGTNGSEFLIDEQSGKTVRLKKKRPRYLKLIR